MDHIRVEVKEGKTGLFYATSPDLRGLLVTGRSADELERNIPEAIGDLSKAMNVSAPSYTIERPCPTTA